MIPRLSSLATLVTALLAHTEKREGYAMVQLFEALRYKPQCCGLDSQCCPWNFSLTHSFRSHYGPGVDSASNRNEYQKYFLGCKGGQCIGLTTLPPSCADGLESWSPILLKPSGPVQACNGIAAADKGEVFICF